jgi:hypothetical protein
VPTPREGLQGHIAELLNDPSNTDTAESMTGLLDHNLHRSLCNFHTIFGVVNAQEMQLFASQASQVDRVNKKKKAADHVTSTSQWDMTAHRSHDKKMRAAMLNVMSRGFNRELVIRPRQAEKEQRTHHCRSQLRGGDKWLEGQMKRIILCRGFKDVVLCTHDTRDEFASKWEKAGAATGAGIGEKIALLPTRFASASIAAAGLGLSDQKNAARRDHAHRHRLQNLH